MAKLTTKPQYKLPPRRWYNLEQACKRIKQLTGEEIEIDDLLHYWDISLLPIHLKVDTWDSSNIYLAGKELKNTKIYVDVEKMERERGFTYFELRFGEGDDIDGFYGFMDLAHLGFIRNDEYIISNYISLYAEDNISKNRCDVEVHLDKDFKIPYKKEFFILEDSIINLLENKTEPDFFLNIRDYSEPIKHKFQTINENQINFIKTLLYMDYGIKTEQEAQNAMRNGKLGRNLEKFSRENEQAIKDLNLKIPTDRTLYNWYKNT